MVPVVPVEASYKTKRVLLNVRYKYALKNRYKNDLQNERTDHYSLLTFEIGFDVPLKRPEVKQAREERRKEREKKCKPLGPTF